MKRLFQYADTYVKEMDIWDVSFLKICLFSIGLIMGICVPNNKKKSMGIMAGLVFILTYIPLMEKFFKIVHVDKRIKK